ncbi:hypothetical protein DPMN_079678 [Dreissena polymorpha]|uniref:Apple domain-containing protein n=1 Tax=Dreissena polymorpha TaxID=45954 RepID=A0A9D3YTL4_DREPO|nr:hypothetical protein DPMN_079678 [Dreissena polymorpha]
MNVYGQKSTEADDNKQLLTQLEKMDEAIGVIVTAIKRRKGRSGPIRNSAVTEVQGMEKKVKETNTFIDSLKKLSNVQLEKVADNIARVNRSAFVKVNANGAVLYGGVGSKCIDTSGECVTPNSECRVGKCQCSLGLSYNLGTQSCVGSCTEYGSTYQSVPLWIIRGFNDRVLNATTLVTCAETCALEKSFVCRSFDWFPHFRTCYLSANAKTGAEDAWEYNSAGYHFQRDCLV